MMYTHLISSWEIMPQALVVGFGNGSKEHIQATACGCIAFPLLTKRQLSPHGDKAMALRKLGQH